MKCRYGKKDKIRFIAHVIEPLDFGKSVIREHEVQLKLIDTELWVEQIRANTPIVKLVGNALLDFKGAEEDGQPPLEFNEELNKELCRAPFVVNGLWKYLAGLQNGVNTDTITAELLGNLKG